MSGMARYQNAGFNPLPNDKFYNVPNRKNFQTSCTVKSGLNSSAKSIDSRQHLQFEQAEPLKFDLTSKRKENILPAIITSSSGAFKKYVG